jgi:hypothetical protein
LVIDSVARGKICRGIRLPIILITPNLISDLINALIAKTWSLTLKEEHKLRVFENRVLMRIFGPKKDEVTIGWRKLHNEELHNSYSSPNIIRVIKSRIMKWGRHVARMGRRGMHTEI